MVHPNCTQHTPAASEAIDRASGGGASDLPKRGEPPEVMAAAYITTEGELTIRQRPLPNPGPGEIVLRTAVSALCGTDLHRFRGATSFGTDTDVYGHESVGAVVRCDSGRFNPGQRVLHVPFPSDGRVFAPYQLARETNVVPLPEGLTARTAVFAQQLGTVIYALRNFWPSPTPPRRAFVAGAGPAGLLFIQLLRQRGCTEVYVHEPDAHRSRLAVTFGALPATAASPAAELSVDASGMIGVRRECWQRTDQHGTVGVYGLPDHEPGDLEISMLELVSKNLRLVGAIGSQAEPGLVSFHEAIHLLETAKVNVEPLVSHEIGLAELPQTALRAAHVQDNIVKVLVTFPSPPPSDAESI